MSITYGIETRDTNDPFVEIAEEALYGLSQTGNPGAFLIDFLPFRMSIHGHNIHFSS